MPDKFFFFSNSRDAPPGRGANEVGDPRNYRVLRNMPHWRRVLSNFHVHPFVFDGWTYNTIEHAFQAAKIALANPDKAYEFTLNSGSALGRGDGFAARKARKIVVLGAEHLREWSGMSKRVMERAAIAKYAASDEAKAVLAATGEAELWHIVARAKPERFVHLERIRAQLL